MTFTVAEAMKIGALRRCKLIAGQAGVEREISYVDGMEVPNIYPWLKKNELMVTTGYSVKNDPLALVQLVREMHRVGAAGLAIKTRFFGELPPSVIETANELALPLIEIPQEIPFIDIITPLMKALVDEQNRKLEFSQQINEKFIEVGLSTEGLVAITSTLADIIEMPVAVVNPVYGLLACVNEKPEWQSFYKKIHRLSEQESNPVQFTPLGKQANLLNLSGEKTPLIARKVMLRRALVGYILIPLPDNGTDELLLIALSHAANSVGLELSRIEVQEKTTQALHNNLFIDLLTSNITHEEEAATRAAAQRWPSPPFLLATIDMVGFETFVRDKEEEDILLIKNQLAEHIRAFLAHNMVRGVVVSKSDSVTLILHRGTNITVLCQLLEKLAVSIQNTYGLESTAGIAGPCLRFLDFPQQYSETRKAVNIARCHGISVLYSEDALLDRAILEGLEGPFLCRFSQKYLAPLEVYDKRAGTPFLRVLECFVENLGAKSITAAQLFVHRNTLFGWLRQIEAIAGIALDSPETILLLGLAFRVRKLLQLKPTTETNDST